MPTPDGDREYKMSDGGGGPDHSGGPGFLIALVIIIAIIVLSQVFDIGAWLSARMGSE